MHYLDSFVCPRPNSGSVTNREHFHGCPLEVSAAPPAAPPERSRSRPKNAPADENEDRESVWLGALSLCYDSRSFRSGFCCFHMLENDKLPPPHLPPSAFVFPQISFTSPSFFHWLFPPLLNHATSSSSLLPPSLPPFTSSSFSLSGCAESRACRYLRPWPRSPTMLAVLRYCSRSLTRFCVCFGPPRVCTSATLKSTFCRCVRLRPF